MNWPRKNCNGISPLSEQRNVSSKREPLNLFTLSTQLINAISAADIAFIMSSSMSAWLLSPLECSPQKQNG